MKKGEKSKSKKFMKKNKFKEFMKKFWHIVWKDDSFKGWIISLVFLFIVIKLIFFPLLSLTTGTQLPLVIVESCSMYHDNGVVSNMEKWWDRHNIKYQKFSITENLWNEFSLKRGFNKGDILFVTGAKPEKIKVGDVIIFNANYRNPIIHRVIEITEENRQYYFSTIGDNNNGQISFEKKISENQVIGKARANIAPYIGWIKLIFFETQKSKSEKGFCTEN